MPAPLDPLPHRVRFVVPGGARWRDLMGADDPPDPDALATRFINAEDVWVVQTFVQLRRRGLAVELAETFDPRTINVASYVGLKPKLPLWRSFILACQHDRARPALCDARVVQNRANVRGPEDHYIPHWPQPGLTPRDPARGDAVRTLTFKGAFDNLAPAYRSDAFLSELRALGVRLVTSDREDKLSRENASGAIDWTDYREADLVLAVREMSPAKLDTKPPTKLINAWLAGTPALLSRESAYEQLRESDLDYIEVASPREAIAAVRRLQDEPGRYRAMIERGLARGREFDADATARRRRDPPPGPTARPRRRRCSPAAAGAASCGSC